MSKKQKAATPDASGQIWELEYETPPRRAIYTETFPGKLSEHELRTHFHDVYPGSKIREISRVLAPLPELRVLSLWQPWASLMALDEKRMETRGWETSYRGLVCIHASKKWNRELARLTTDSPFREALLRVGADNLPFGKVLAVACLNEIHRTGSMHFRDIANISGAKHEHLFGDYSAGRFAWRFNHLLPLQTPIDLKASQGLFHAPPDLRAQIADQLPELKLL